MSPTMAFIILSVITIVWVVILIPFCRDMIKLRRLRRNGEIVSGKIIEYKIEKRDSEVKYIPVVEFIASNGDVIRYVSHWDESTNMPVIGEQVTLLYNRDDPRQVIKYDTSINSEGLFLILFVGIILLVIWIAAVSQGFKVSGTN